MLSIEIVNVIATTRIKGKINVISLSKELPNTKYNPAIFAGLVYRRTDKPTIILFESGRISSHGAKSEKTAKSAIVEILAEINKMGCVPKGVEIENITIQNVVGTANFGHEIDLESVYSTFPSSIYEPEQFPGLIYRPFNNSVVCLIFSTGKMVIAGATSENEVGKAFQAVANRM
jgi:transcription initiation factor TFIID TATA-box-binding protein